MAFVSAKDGTKIFYRLLCPCLDGFWKCLEATLREKLKAQQSAMGA